MENWTLMLSGRVLQQDGVEYLPLVKHGLREETCIVGGSGEPDDPTIIDVSITNTGQVPWDGIIHVSLSVRREELEFFLMPGFLYGTNRGDTPMEGRRFMPRLRDSMELPASPWWMVRSDRLSHPAALLWNGGRVTGLHASPYWTLVDGVKTASIGRDRQFYQYSGFTCCIDSDRCEVGYTLGYENAPWLIEDARNFRDRPPLDGQCFRLEASEMVSFRLYIYDYPAPEVTWLYQALENVYWFYHESPVKRASAQDAVKAIADAIFRDAWLPEKKQYAGFVFDRPKTSVRELGSFSWTNGLSVAVPMLMAAVRLENDAMLEQALSCIDCIVANCLNPRSGLPFDGYVDGHWTVHGWWFDTLGTPGHTGYIVGQGLTYLMKAYKFLRDICRDTRDAWAGFTESVLTRLERQKNQDGEYPYVLSAATGAGLEYDSLGSVWCLAATLTYMEATGERCFLDGARESEEHYYQTYVRTCQGYGGPLDISKGIDSEGILAYIRAVAALHRLTGEERYLERLRNGLAYEFSFKFCYNSPVKIPPLSETGWCSSGGSITSVVNPHIHPMSSTVADELLYYTRATDDRTVRSRLEDVLLWGTQTFNHYDGEFGYGKKGWMSERFCHCQGLLKERGPDGSPSSTWFALMPWAGASILECFTGDVWNAVEIQELFK